MYRNSIIQRFEETRKKFTARDQIKDKIRICRACQKNCEAFGVGFFLFFASSIRFVHNKQFNILPLHTHSHHTKEIVRVDLLSNWIYLLCYSKHIYKYTLINSPSGLV